MEIEQIEIEEKENQKMEGIGHMVVVGSYSQQESGTEMRIDPLYHIPVVSFVVFRIYLS
jgi:hypothetical protein